MEGKKYGCVEGDTRDLVVVDEDKGSSGYGSCCGTWDPRECVQELGRDEFCTLRTQSVQIGCMNCLDEKRKSFNSTKTQGAEKHSIQHRVGV